MQEKIYKEFGLFYQRKSGEFGDGIKNKYLDRSQIIERAILLRLCLACDLQPSQARSKSEESMFRKGSFETILASSDRYKEYVFAYYCFISLNKIHRDFGPYTNNPDGIIHYGYALRNGRFAVISAIMKGIKIHDIPTSKFQELSLELVSRTLKRWIEFENHVVDLPTNRAYFREEIDEETDKVTRYLNFDGYYKGRTVNNDIFKFDFNKNKELDVVTLLLLLK